jgi:hypothetical protein
MHHMRLSALRASGSECSKGHSIRSGKRCTEYADFFVDLVNHTVEATLPTKCSDQLSKQDMSWLHVVE